MRIGLDMWSLFNAPKDRQSGSAILGVTFDYTLALDADGLAGFKALGDLAVYLDASDVSSLTLSGANANAWANKADTGLIASVAGTGHAPQYSATALGGSKPGLTFDGSSQYMAGSFGSTVAQPTTDFIVASSSVPGTDVGILIDGIDGSNRHVVDAAGNTNRFIETYAGNSVVSAGNAFTNGTPFVLCAKFNGASSAIYVNGSSIQTGDCGSHSQTGLTVGVRYSLDSFWFTGTQSLILQYRGALNSTQIGKVFARINSLWSIY